MHTENLKTDHHQLNTSSKLVASQRHNQQARLLLPTSHKKNTNVEPLTYENIYIKPPKTDIQENPYHTEQTNLYWQTPDTRHHNLNSSSHP